MFGSQISMYTSIEYL